MRSMLENGGTLRPNARTLWEIQEKAMRPPAETAANLYMEICARAKEALKRGEARRAAVRDGETLKAYQQEVRRLFLPLRPRSWTNRLMGSSPWKRCCWSPGRGALRRRLSIRRWGKGGPAPPCCS